MVKKIVYFALGGHITNQNVSFQRLKEGLPEYQMYGAVNGFEAFKTGQIQDLTDYIINENFAGSVFGAGRDSLKHKDGALDDKKIAQAIEFFKRGQFDVAIGSGGDDHGMQMSLLENILKEHRTEIGKEVRVFVLNKTMDNDLGGPEGLTDFTNGFHTAVSVGVNEIKNHFIGAWTNNLPYLVGFFGRETNWVGSAVSYFGNADRFIYGELPEEHPGHSLERIHELILQSQDQNEKKYGKRFAMIVVAEGTRIAGIEHSDPDIIDPHGNHKLNPEVLVVEIKKALDKQYRMKTQTLGITYEMRNSPPTEEDKIYGRLSADILMPLIRSGATGYESTFKIKDEKVSADSDLIYNVSQKRMVSHYSKKPIIDRENFQLTEEIGDYYRPLFGKRQLLESWLPSKPKIINLSKWTKIIR